MTEPFRFYIKRRLRVFAFVWLLFVAFVLKQSYIVALAVPELTVVNLRVA